MIVVANNKKEEYESGWVCQTLCYTIPGIGIHIRSTQTNVSWAFQPACNPRALLESGSVTSQIAISGFK